MKLWSLLISTEVCLWLLALVCAMMGAGSFLLSGDYAAAINAMPLVQWLISVPPAISWWLWITLVLLLLLVVNTVCCSAEAIRVRWGRAGWTDWLGPQLIHAGFLLIVCAHLQSAFGSFQQQIEVAEGMPFTLPDGSRAAVAAISATMSPMGMPVGFSAELLTNPRNPADRAVLSPNHPWFSGGYGVYIKQAELSPYPRALLEVHREPGASAALAGGMLFTVGNAMLLYCRSKQRENSKVWS